MGFALANAAAAILVGGLGDDLPYCVDLAAESIASGAAYGKLRALVELSGGNLSVLDELEGVAWLTSSTSSVAMLKKQSRQVITPLLHSAKNRQTSASTLRLSECITTCTHLPLIAEIKIASPTMGALRVNMNAGEIAKHMEAGGATGISVVTEPHFFKGSARLLEDVRKRRLSPTPYERLHRQRMPSRSRARLRCKRCIC